MSIVNFEAIDTFHNSLKDSHLSHAAKVFLKKLGITVIVKGKIPITGPVLLISNHPGGLDSFVVLSSISREDYYPILIASHQKFGKVISEKMLPIYRKQTIRDLLLKLFAPDFLTHVMNNNDEIRRKNRESIAKAAELLSNGHAVAIYPNGTGGKRPKKGTWKTGVGFLAKQITNSNTQIIFACIDNTGMKDFFRYLNPSLRKLFLRDKEVTVTFSKPYLLSKLVNTKLDGKEIAFQLEKVFIQSAGLS